MNKRNVEAIYPLSPMQQGMLFHSIYSPDSGMYFEQLTCIFEGDLNIPAFRKSWEAVIDRHPILRTSYVWKRLDKTLQVVHKKVELPFEIMDWRQDSSKVQQEKLDNYLNQNQQKGFNLSEAPLIRLAIARLSENEYQFIGAHHHLLMDGWSFPLVIREVFTYYEAFRQNQQIQLSPVRPYRDYIGWLQKQDMHAAEDFWRQRLQGFSAPTPLTVDNVGETQPKDTQKYADIKTALPETATTQLQELVRKEKLTLNMVVQAAWAVLLSRYSRNDDIVFGATVSGRPPELDGVESMVGLFINTLPIRAQMNPGRSFRSWLKNFQAEQIELRQFEFAPLTEIQRWSDVPHDLPLFESILVFENYPVDDTLQAQNTSLKAKDIRSFEKTNYPITLVAAPGKELFLQIAYDATRFSEFMIQQILTHLKQILTEIADNPELRLNEITLLTEKEQQQILNEWNRTQAEFPAEKCVHEVFEDLVRKQPDATALVFESDKLTYAELNSRANQLAYFLQKQGVGPEVLVGIATERSIEMIVGMLGVLKAGGAYLPIDPNYPKDRLGYIFEDSKISILLTQEALVPTMPALDVPVLALDKIADALQQESTENLPNVATPQNLAYVIYTSGSTGKPKGTLLPHFGLVNFATAQIRDMQANENSQVLQFASMSFDASVAEIYLALLSGGTLHVARQETLLSAVELAKLLKESRISEVTLPPSMLTVLPPDELPELHSVMSVGEACTKDIVERWAPGRTFWNGYGPTEATIGTSWCQIEIVDENQVNLPIGRPIANKEVYILDKNWQPVPIGVPGELVIGGVGLARGYLNRPELTAEKFIPNPFSGQPGERLYRTGDLVRYLPNGMIEFMGRIDYQVKIRGFRIELGEIESVLNQHPAVQSAAVLAREDQPGEKRLVAYFVPENETEIQTTDLYEFLKDRLPDYMVPAYFMQLDEFPLTHAGKINRHALPVPDPGRPELGKAYVAPRTQLEELLATIWADVLGVTQVGAFDNFFELGGHSLLGVKLQSRLRDALQNEIPLKLLFESPILAEFALEIEKFQISSDGIEAPPIEPVSREEALPLSFAQQRLWFLDQLEPNSPFYNIPAALEISGALNVTALEKSINEIVKRHESLRTIFKSRSGKPYQEILPEAPVVLEVQDLSGMETEEQENHIQKLAREEAQKPFNLSEGPLFRVSLVKTGETAHVIFFNMHHIISDGWSVNVLVKEVAECYPHFDKNEAPDLPPLPVQYADFAHWQQNWLKNEVLENQLEYWKTELAESSFILELPTDRPRPAVQTFQGATISRSFSEKLRGYLVKLSQTEGSTLFMTLLAAYQTLLFRHTGQANFNVGTPHANRNRLETENLIGFFVNTLVIPARFEGNPTFKQILKQVRQATLGAYTHQDLPFEMLVEALQPERDLSHTPIFQVMFVLQNMPMQQLELPGLTFTPFSAESETTKFDLSLIMAETKTGFEVTFEYNTDLFDARTIERLLDHFELLLEAIVTDPAKPVARIPVMNPSEMHQILKTWNDSAAEFPTDLCMHQWFEQIVANTPNAPALSFEGQTLTYGELNQRANQLARYLLKMNLTTESLIGICMERSREMVIGILASLKAGCAFVPLDPVYPAERLAYMIEDSRLSVLLSQEALKAQLADFAVKRIFVDTEWDEISTESPENLNLSLAPENLAYVIYTSGSTGKPKGTMLQHRGWCNLARAQQIALGVGAGKRILQFSSLSFDASVWEIVMALLSGATLCLTRREMLMTGQGLADVLEQEKITTVTLPPSVLAVVPDRELPALSTIITAGEACTSDLVSRWREGREFFNAYGPTETTVCASIFPVPENLKQNPPIGKPITNFQLYILDAELQPVPVGVPGELHIGGAGIARGYLNRPELTAEKFIPDPFNSEPGQRLYRSGDLARFLPDGNVEFLGRIDHQVKIRGFRIELGEIDAALAEHPDIVDTLVLVREDRPGDKRIVAYLVLKNGIEITSRDLRAYLKKNLPEYMIPFAFVVLEKFPLTPNGKIDRKALPAPEHSRLDLETQYVAPSTEIEKSLAEICKDLLNIDRVGIHDNFFEMGGHSLLATQFMSRIREDFAVELPLRTLFESPTITELAEKIMTAPKISESEDGDALEMTERGEEDLGTLLAELDGMSEAEVKALLEQEDND